MPIVAKRKMRGRDKPSRRATLLAAHLIAGLCLVATLRLATRLSSTPHEGAAEKDGPWKASGMARAGGSVAPLRAATGGTILEVGREEGDAVAPLQVSVGEGGGSVHPAPRPSAGIPVPPCETAAEGKPEDPIQPPTGFSGGAAEQIVGMMASGCDRSGMPPMPAVSEESLLKDLAIAITNDIEIFDDDTPERAAFKKKVADFKNQLAEIAREGGSLTDTLAEYEGWINGNKAIRDSVIGEYRRLKAEASQEEADEYLARANAELEAEGIETVNLGAERRRNRRADAGSGDQQGNP